MSKVSTEPYEGPSGGWGSAESVLRYVGNESPTRSTPALLKQNKPDGFMCVSCAWAKPAHPHPAEFCENGAKATTWELTSKTIGPEFFEKHTVSELLTWPDHDLEEAGRLTHPLRYDPARDRYLPIAWDAAFKEIGAELRQIDPHAAVFYASGRASLETSYMYQLFARLFGSNNLPDSSNMCHETTSVALPESIGVPVGTVTLEDFDETECIFFFGQNVGTNSPRMLHQLQDVSRRGVPIVTFNPLRERGLERFTNPQSPTEMALGQETRISSRYYQVTAGGDIAAILGICKAVIAMDDEAQSTGATPVIDHAFITEHTHGFDEFTAMARRTSWSEIERCSGLPRRDLEESAAIYAHSTATMAMYGMGLTQHRKGVQSVQMLINLLLLKGNIGKPGAGICPVRGHSNVQGQRTVGISEKPKLVPLDKLKEQYGFEPPRWEGLTTVDACEGIVQGKVHAFVGLGGNFIRAVPDHPIMEKAWRDLHLSVQVSTKLNRNHLVTGKISYILPCLGRIEVDRQASGPQAVSMEDSTACIHGSRGVASPISEHLLSEPRIVAELAKATLGPNPKVDWDGWVADYSKIRDAIEATYPDQFKDFNKRMWTPSGFPRPLAARERKWNTDTGKANFKVPESMTSHGLDLQPDTLRLITLRSNDQFNTTIYGYHDRFRGIEGTRMVLLISKADMERFGLTEAEMVTLVGEPSDDQVQRAVPGLRVVPYDIPEGCVASYYPECNPLIPIAHHAEQSKVPAAKSVPVRVRKEAASAAPV
ncbi:MAG TPA: FdhF/YdeP family oxidoreductase [Geminicoccus sp.]|jgi:molybdopterin-dependent oxidoreductase alpha subunit|uniref:FdhF/YdeP family oxidoreductase n=1 Tax=Geminicoccus sp. TaxID=2024832 RepID=UPI002E33B3D2|nr:FdhF/YdeP family oxidoreductase [Geminicoccus sp.]HEX2527826.1 FdhF/YdeP family oxidoreductase [Geminicoccus sp.]